MDSALVSTFPKKVQLEIPQFRYIQVGWALCVDGQSKLVAN